MEINDLDDARRAMQRVTDRAIDANKFKYTPSPNDVWLYVVMVARALMAVIDYLIKQRDGK